MVFVLPILLYSIFALHMSKRQQSIENLDVTGIAQRTEGFSGAEIEQLVVSALYHTYARDEKIDTELMLELIDKTSPLSVLTHEKIQALRDWAEQCAVRV